LYFLLLLLNLFYFIQFLSNFLIDFLIHLFFLLFKLLCILDCLLLVLLFLLFLLLLLFLLILLIFYFSKLILKSVRLLSILFLNFRRNSIFKCQFVFFKSFLLWDCLYQWFNLILLIWFGFLLYFWTFIVFLLLVNFWLDFLLTLIHNHLGCCFLRFYSPWLLDNFMTLIELVLILNFISLWNLKVRCPLEFPPSSFLIFLFLFSLLILFLSFLFFLFFSS
jgi:hypothetical protein